MDEDEKGRVLACSTLLKFQAQIINLLLEANKTLAPFYIASLQPASFVQGCPANSYLVYSGSDWCLRIT